MLSAGLQQIQVQFLVKIQSPSRGNYDLPNGTFFPSDTLINDHANWLTTNLTFFKNAVNEKS